MKKMIVMTVVAVLAATSAFAVSPVNSTLFGSKAIKGYDPVAYFTEGKPVKGAKQFTYKWKDATWYFSTAENLAAFMDDPEKYAPQYGGYCAWAAAQGYTAKIDPEAWKIVDDRLYLNYSKDVQAQWAQDIPGNIVKGDANWPQIRADLGG
jgi:YHS domain-containing protein